MPVHDRNIPSPLPSGKATLARGASEGSPCPRFCVGLRSQDSYPPVEPGPSLLILRCCEKYWALCRAARRFVQLPNRKRQKEPTARRAPTSRNPHEGARTTHHWPPIASSTSS